MADACKHSHPYPQSLPIFLLLITQTCCMAAVRYVFVLNSTLQSSSRVGFFFSLNILISPGRWDQFVLFPFHVHKMMWFLLRHGGYALFEMKLFAGRKKQVTSIFFAFLVSLFQYLFAYNM